jgi:hypothetical protein
MQKTMQNRVRSTPDVESLSYSDFLARLNAVYGAMADKPPCLNSPVDMAGFKAAIDRYAAAVSAVVHGRKAAILERDKCRAEATAMLHSLANMLFEGDRSVDTNARLSPDQKPSPSLSVPPLGCRNKRGKRYVRPRHIQAELRRIVPLDPSEWIGRVENFQNETLVCLSRLTLDSHPAVCGVLIKELRKRIRYRVQKFCGEMDDYDAEQFVESVEGQILELVLTKQPSTEREILEVAFGRAVKNLAIDESEKFKNSTAGHIADIAVDYTNVDGAEEGEEVERPIEFLPDATSGPENILLNLDMKKHRHRLLRKALKAVTDPRHREAVILHHGHGIPITSCQRGKKCLTRHFRKDADEIKYWLRKAMQQMRAALGIQPRTASVHQRIAAD